jgi:hypothetical protein
MPIYDEYQRFWKRLSKVERAALAASGFDPAKPDDAGVPLAHRYFGGEPLQDQDGTGFKREGYDINKVQAVRWDLRERGETEVSDRTYTQDEFLDALRRILAVLGDSLEITCLRLALGIPGQPTMTAIAEKHGLTRAAISSRVKTVQKKLGLPPSVYMKSDSACAKLSNARRKKLK